MIYSYAIEPSAVIKWAKNPLFCHYIKENFGIGQARLMAEFPKLKNWRKQLRRDSAMLGDMEQQRLTALFEHLIEKMSQLEGQQYDGDISWLENALREKSSRYFRAIIATNNPTQNHSVLIHDQIEDWPLSEKWETKHGIPVSRTPDCIAEAVAPMLNNSKKIIFIDPYFRATQDRLLLLQALLNTCTNDANQRDIEIHTSVKENSPSTFQKDLEKKLPRIVPKGYRIKIIRWKQKKDGGEKLHNRYILTDIGGVTFGIGLNSGNIGETEDIALMGREQYLKRWEQYSGDIPSFDLENCFEITGSR